MKRSLVNLLLALLLGGALAGWVVHERNQADSSGQWSTDELPYGPLSDRVVNILDGLRDDGVHVTPDARHLLDRAAEQAVAKQVARTLAKQDLQVYVVVASNANHAGNSAFGIAMQLETELAKQTQHGVLLVWQGPQAGSVEYLGSGYLSGVSAHADFVGEPATTIPELVRRVGSAARPTEAHSPDGGNAGEVAGGIALGLVYGAVALGVLLLLGALLRRITGLPLRGSWGLSNESRSRR